MNNVVDDDMNKEAKDVSIIDGVSNEEKGREIHWERDEGTSR